MNNIAPGYLSSLIKLRSPNKYNVRLDNDFYLLEISSFAHLKRAEGALSYQGPRIWNELPYEIRSLNELSIFKTELKTYYFNLASFRARFHSCTALACNKYLVIIMIIKPPSFKSSVNPRVSSLQ